MIIPSINALLHGDHIPVGSIMAFSGPLVSRAGSSYVWSCEDPITAPDTTPELPDALAAEPSAIAEYNSIMIESSGWMLCDGRYLYSAQCKDLYRALGEGEIYGKGPENATFYIPDYRGVFLRAVDYGIERDPDANDRLPADGTTEEKTSGVGSRQCDALQEHEHNYKSATIVGTGTSDKGAAADPSKIPTTNPIPPARISSETRPINIAVNYIIKYSN